MIDMKKIKFKEGIDSSKFTMNFFQENSEKVLKLFGQYNYDLELDATSAKIFAIPTKAKFIDKNGEAELTIGELEESLKRINELGLKDLFSVNLSLATLKMNFISRVEWCINNNLPYLNEDNTFASVLFSNEAFAEYSATLPLEQIKTSKELDGPKVQANEPKQEENKNNGMDPEDKLVYNEIITKLSYLVLGNPTDDFLIKVVDNIKTRIVEPIVRKEYKFLSINEMVSNIMFDGLDTTPVDNIRIEELILNTFPETERKL